MVTDPRGTHVVVHIMHGVHMFIYDLYMIKYAQHKKVYGTYVIVYGRCTIMSG